MHIQLEYSVEELTALTYELLEKNKLDNAYIRPLVYLGANMALQPNCRCSYYAICLGMG